MWPWSLSVLLLPPFSPHIFFHHISLVTALILDDLLWAENCVCAGILHLLFLRSYSGLNRGNLNLLSTQVILEPWLINPLIVTDTMDLPKTTPGVACCSNRLHLLLAFILWETSRCKAKPGSYHFNSGYVKEVIWQKYSVCHVGLWKTSSAEIPLPTHLLKGQKSFLAVLIFVTSRTGLQFLQINTTNPKTRSELLNFKRELIISPFKKYFVALLNPGLMFLLCTILHCIPSQTCCVVPYCSFQGKEQ